MSDVSETRERLLNEMKRTRAILAEHLLRTGGMQHRGNYYDECAYWYLKAKTEYEVFCEEYPAP